MRHSYEGAGCRAALCIAVCLGMLASFGLFTVGCGSGAHAGALFDENAPIHGGDPPTNSGNVGAGTFCVRQTPTPFFCADYDEGDVTRAFQNGAPFDAPFMTQGGTVALDTSNAHSPSGSFAASIPAGSGTAWYQAPVSLPGVASARLRFQMRLDAIVPTSGMVSIARISMRQAGATALFEGELAVDVQEARLSIAAHTRDGSDATDAPLPPASTWVPVEMTLALSPVPSVSVSVAGALPVMQRASVALASGDADFNLGLDASGTTLPVDAGFDDVLFTAN